MKSKKGTRLRFITALIIWFAMVGAYFAPVQAQQGIDNRPEARPEVVWAERTDSSQPLREIPPHEPQWSDRVHRPRKMLPDRPGTPDGATDSIVQQSAPPSALLAGMSFDGVNNFNSVLPADTNGDVGPNHYVQTVNIAMAVYDRYGNRLYGPTNINALYKGFGGPCETSNDGDPIVQYDHLADRWLISQFALPYYPSGPYYECIAISQTGDPTGAYYRYQFQTSVNNMNDYPKFGVWPDGYYMSANQFTNGASWGGQGAAVFERDKMLLGQPARMVYFDLFNTDANLGGMLPSDLDGPVPPAGEPNHFAQIDDNAWGYSPDQLQIWDFKVNWSNPASSTFTRAQALPTSTFDAEMCGGARNCIPQPGGAPGVDAISDRLMYRLQYRNFGGYQTLVVNHTVDVNQANRAGIRWYELRKSGAGGWTIYQQGTFSPDANHRWMGSAAMNGQGQIALGYSVSSTGLNPSIYYTGRLSGDPLGQLTLGEGTIIAGGGYQQHSSGRWGDYSSMSVDPLDDCSFWFTSQYYSTISSYSWQTRIGKFQLAACPATDIPPSAAITSPLDGATVSGTIYLYANASDDVQVTQVAFYADGALLSVDSNGTDGYSAPWNSTLYPNGSHTLKAMATDNTGKTGGDTNQVTSSNAGNTAPIHVGDLDGSGILSGSGRWDATVTILVEDNNHRPITGASVTGTWGGKGSVSCTTNTTGLCSLSKTRLSTRTTSQIFSVNNLSASGFVYQPGLNHDPDGSSNGTSITINAPK